VPAAHGRQAYLAALAPKENIPKNKHAEPMLATADKVLILHPFLKEKAGSLKIIMRNDLFGL
jgi:hypothetical protein